MANNISVTAGSGTVLKTTDNAGVHTPHHNIDLIAPGTNFIGAVKTRFFAVAAATLTRPANTTAYTANDAIANDATAGSVMPFSFTVSNANDDPVTLERVRIDTTDTGLQGKNVRMWLFRASPTPGAGDNAAFICPKANFIGTMSGTLRATSDGAVGVLTPDEGARIITLPASGAQTVFGLLQTLNDFTPSANATTVTPTAEGFQGRA